MMDSASPRRGEKVSYYSAVCLETGEGEVMELEGNPPQADQLCRLPAVRQWRTGAAHPTSDGDLGQLSSPSGRRDTGLSHHSQPKPTPGEPRIEYGAGSAQLQSGLQSRRGHLGLGESGSNRQPVPGNPCRSPGESGRLFHRSDPATRSSQTPLPNRAASKSRRINWPHPSQPSPPCKCRFHLGFGLAYEVRMPPRRRSCWPGQC